MSVKAVQIGVRFEMAIAQAVMGGSFIGSASVSGGGNSATPSICMVRHWSSHFLLQEHGADQPGDHRSHVAVQSAYGGLMGWKTQSSHAGRAQEKKPSTGAKTVNNADRYPVTPLVRIERNAPLIVPNRRSAAFPGLAPAALPPPRA